MVEKKEKNCGGKMFFRIQKKAWCSKKKKSCSKKKSIMEKSPEEKRYGGEKKGKKIPSSRIRTSDLWITIVPLQSTALPTELSKATDYIVAKLLLLDDGGEPRAGYGTGSSI